MEAKLHGVTWSPVVRELLTFDLKIPYSTFQEVQIQEDRVKLALALLEELERVAIEHRSFIDELRKSSMKEPADWPYPFVPFTD